MVKLFSLSYHLLSSGQLSKSDLLATTVLLPVRIQKTSSIETLVALSAGAIKKDLLMVTTKIHCNCASCGKAFSLLGSMAGKTFTCNGCGATVVAQAGGGRSPSNPPNYQPPPTSHTSTNVTSQTTNNSTVQNLLPLPKSSAKTFHALIALSQILIFISWLYVVVAILIPVGGLLFYIQNQISPPAEAVGLIFFLTIFCLLFALFIRAAAEGIRLALYIAELLENIRDKV